MRDSAEEARRAVMKVVETESLAYVNRDYKTWAGCFVHSPHIQRWVSGPSGAAAWTGWEQQAAILWMNAAAEKELHDLRSLVVRTGCLRAVDRTSDQRLQAAIRWAGPIDHRHFDLPRHGALPIVLDGVRGEPTNVCWVIAR